MFCEIIITFKLLTIFAKSSILDVWMLRKTRRFSEQDQLFWDVLKKVRSRCWYFVKIDAAKPEVSITNRRYHNTAIDNTNKQIFSIWASAERLRKLLGKHLWWSWVLVFFAFYTSSLSHFLSKSCWEKLPEIHRKELCWSSFFNKVPGRDSATLLKKTTVKVFSWIFSEQFSRTPLGNCF